MQFGDRLKQLREDAGLTQDEISKIMKVERSTYGKWETNTSKPDFDKLLWLAKYFNVTTDYLLGNLVEDSDTRIDTIAAHAVGDLTKEEQEEILKFAKYIKSQRK